MRKLRPLLHCLAVLAAACLAAEVVARLDDWIHLGVPVSANPDRERDLTLAESWGFRGRPHGAFRKWKLNQFGFRGPEISRQPPADCTRVMILGASETFGLYESPGKEYPRQLEGLLESDGPVEVVNAAMAGITLRSMVPYLDHWAAQFRPRIVLIYPSPLFYLDDEPPGAPKPPERPAADESGLKFRPRLLTRLNDMARGLPVWVKGIRDQWVIRKRIAGKSEDWFFTSPPEDRLQLFHEDLAEMVRRVRQHGAEPVLVTHAHSAASPPRPEDLARLRSMRMFFTRATPETIVTFEGQANQAVLDVARQQNVRVIDAARAMTGNRDYFADLVHFTDEGAAAMARTLAEGLRRSEGQLLCGPRGK